MKLHLSEPISDIRHVAKSIEQIVTLYAANFLLDDSEVWIRTRDQRYLWTLTDRSALVSVSQTTHPGAIRITNGRIRTGSTFEQAQNDPDDTIYFEQLNDTYGVDSGNNYTHIVNHALGDETVKVIDQSESRQLTNGQYYRDGISVIDLCHYKRDNFYYLSPDGSQASYTRPQDEQLGGPNMQWRKCIPADAPVREYEQAHAIVNGSAFITAGLSKKKKEHYRKHYDEYTLDLQAGYLNELVDLLINGYARVAQVIQREQNRVLSELDNPVPEDDDTDLM